MYKNCKYKCKNHNSDTSEAAKINFINSGAVNIIRTAYYIHGAEFVKLFFCRFRCVINNGPYTLLQNRFF